mgnify:FL=1
MLTYRKEEELKQDILLFIEKKGGASFEEIVNRFRTAPKRIINEILRSLERKKKITHQVINQNSLFSIK